jgi:hypothetical protein
MKEKIKEQDKKKCAAKRLSVNVSHKCRSLVLLSVVTHFFSLLDIAPSFLLLLLLLLLCFSFSFNTNHSQEIFIIYYHPLL